MIVLDVEQGSRAWVEARLGRPTASQFGRILTPKRLTPSSSRLPYMDELLGEWVTGEPAQEWDTEWTERGRVLEPEARRAYSFQTDCEVRSVGLVGRRVGLAGLGSDGYDVAASPDGLVDVEHFEDVRRPARGALELKVPKVATHIGYLSRGELPAAYIPQVQGQIFVGQFEFVDFCSYHPGLPPLIVRVLPDPHWQDALDEALPAFVAELEAGKERLLALGVQPFASVEEAMEGA